jgi:hypothetical protein
MQVYVQRLPFRPDFHHELFDEGRSVAGWTFHLFGRQADLAVCDGGFETVRRLQWVEFFMGRVVVCGFRGDGFGLYSVDVPLARNHFLGFDLEDGCFEERVVFGVSVYFEKYLLFVAVSGFAVGVAS